ncbi:Fanconi anemia complementation group I [Glossina fuscipes fuscipes]
MSSTSAALVLEKQMYTFNDRRMLPQLQKLLQNTSTKKLTDILENKLGRNEFAKFWDCLLLGFSIETFEAREKRFACVKCFLDGLLKVELTYRQTYDLITRLCLDLQKFPNEHLIEILEHCVDHLRVADPKCVGWKDLLPPVLNILTDQRTVIVNGITMGGLEYRDSIVKNLFTMRWPSEVLTPLADMCRELQLSANEITVVVNKFCGYVQSLAPMALPALAYQLFSICSTASQIIVPILALDKYFYRFYYKKLFADMNSNSVDFDSIDKYSDKEMREAEETILHHLDLCTQIKITEQQMCAVLRNFISMPDIILTPFVLSAILTMSKVNRNPSCGLSASILLPFLRSVICRNEDEHTLSEYSVWCRETLHRQHVDIEQIFKVLIDQNKDGKDMVTPGLVNLVFVLLKSKQNPSLQQKAINFLTKFIRKRFIFGHGIIKKLAEWMIVEPDQNQYSECLTLLSVADTFTVSECVETIDCVLETFLWMPGDHSMQMMPFILPLLKISPIITNSFINVLRKAIRCNDVKVHCMAVYGFCMILKQLNNCNSQRSQVNVSSICTQQNISSCGFMSQSASATLNRSHRHFDMLSLDIMGILRNCLQQSVDVKVTLYENLQRAVELNNKLVPHIVQFIDWHFRSYFESPLEEDDSNQFKVKFEKITKATDDQENEIHIYDNLGLLLVFIAHCLVIFENFEYEYNVREMRRLIETSIERTLNKGIKFESTMGNLTLLKNELILQQLNFLEGLMAYCILMSKSNNDYVKHILGLFKEHENLMERLKSLSTKKSIKKSKTNIDPENATLGSSINSSATKKGPNKPENIWNLVVVERFMRLLHEDVVPFASANMATPLRSHVNLVRYVLEVAGHKVEAIHLQPLYKQLSHSKRTFKYLSDITKVVYERCIKVLPMLWKEFDLTSASLATECFRQCLNTANITYKTKFSDTFVRNFDLHASNKSSECILVLQNIIQTYMEEESSDAADSMLNDPEGCKIPYNLLLSLEILYENISFDSRMTVESYSWLLKFCEKYEINNKELSLVHKLLFKQRQKTHSGAFFQTIPLHFSKLWSSIRDEVQEEDVCTQSRVKLKSITVVTAESCLLYTYEAIRKQIEDVEYFITKANNLTYKCRIADEDDRDFCLAALSSLERSICSQLIHVSQTLINFTNVCIPLGTSMDGLLKVVMQHYVCLKNMAKHFLNCCAGDVKVSLRGTKFDILLKVVGKALPSNFYALITYIESNVLDTDKKHKRNPQVGAAKVLRETKFISKVILCIENFNKTIVLLAKRTDLRLANFVHVGTARDYRVKTSDLKAAIDRTLSHSSQIEDAEVLDDSNGNEVEGENENENEDEETLLEQIEEESRLLENQENENEEDEEEEETNDDYQTRRSSVSKKASSDERKLENSEKNNRKNKSKENKTSTDNVIESDSTTCSPITPDDNEVLRKESENVDESQLRKNVAKINARSTRKRTQRDSDAPEAVSEQPTKRRASNRLSSKK